MDSPESTNPAHPSQTLRHGDTGAGIPPSAGVEDARLLTDGEVAEHKRQEDEQERERLSEQLQQLEAEATVHLPVGVVRIVVGAGFLLASVLGLLVITQAASLIVDIGMMSAPWNWVLGSLGAVFTAILIWITSKLARSLLRLQRSPSVNLPAIRALQERQAWHRLATEHADQAEAKLRDYLAAYNLDVKVRRSLVASGLAAGEFDDLAVAKQHLLGDELFLPPSEWLDEFVRTFQSVLDSAAERRSKSFGVRTAVGTALSPVPVLDQAIVLYSSLKLVRDLLVLYNVRPTPGQTATVFARAIVQTYVGGEAQRVAEAGVESAWREIVGTPEELLGTSVAGVASKVTAKFAEGSANGLLVWRLGRRAVTFLQPVRRSS